MLSVVGYHIKFIWDYKVTVIGYIRSDLIRYCGKASYKNFIWFYFYDRAFKFQVFFRLTKSKVYLIKLLAKIRLKYLIWKTGINIPPNTRIGKGLYLGHGQGIVINSGTIIGDNCNISHFVSIGTNLDRPATIGNSVYIGPNVSIVEDVIIGDNVTIGAGSVVTKDIPRNTTVVGVPAKIIHQNKPARFIKNKS